MGRAFDHSTSFVDAMMYNNIIINGGMDIDQQNAGGSVALASGTNKYVTDMFYAGFTNTGAVFAAQQVNPLLAGFPNALQLKATTAITSVAAGDFANFQGPIEGFRWQRLAYGTANAMPVTISFWLVATVNGTFTVCLRNAAANRVYLTNLSYTAAPVAQYFSVTIPGDTTGTWAVGTSIGVWLGFCFCAGSSQQGTNNAWQAGNLLGTASTTNFFGVANNLVQITGLTCFMGNEGPSAARAPYCQRPWQEERYLCQRYLEQGIEPQMWLGGAMTATGGYGYVPFTVTKRIAPSMSSSGWQYWTGGSAAAVTPVWASSVYQGTYTTSGLTNWNGWVTGGSWTADARM